MIDTAAPVFDLVIPQKAHLVLTWRKRLEDDSYVDFTGYEARGSVRTSLDADSAELLDLTPYLTVDVTRIRLSVPATITAELDFDAGFWDLITESPGGVIERFLQGAAVLDRGVTE